MARVQPPHVQGSQPLQGEPEGRLVPAGEVGPAESPVRKDGVAGQEVMGRLIVQADPARGMARGMDHPECPDLVPVTEQAVGRSGRRPLAEEHRCRKEVVRKPRGIGGVDADLGPRHVPDLRKPGGVVIVAVGEDNHLDLTGKGTDLKGGDPGIDENVMVEVGVGSETAPGDPSDGHEE